MREGSLSEEAGTWLEWGTPVWLSLAALLGRVNLESRQVPGGTDVGPVRQGSISVTPNRPARSGLQPLAPLACYFVLFSFFICVVDLTTLRL